MDSNAYKNTSVNSSVNDVTASSYVMASLRNADKSSRGVNRDNDHITRGIFDSSSNSSFAAGPMNSVKSNPTGNASNN